MICGVVRTGFIEKNGHRLDPEFYLGGPMLAATCDRVAAQHDRQAVNARENAAIIRKHVDDLAATGEVEIISNDSKGRMHDAAAARFLARTLKK